MASSNSTRQSSARSGWRVASASRRLRARIKALVDKPDDRTVDFFYSASETDNEQFVNRISEASREAKVQLHVLHPLKDGRLDAARICETGSGLEGCRFLFLRSGGFRGHVTQGPHR